MLIKFEAEIGIK